MKLNTIGVYARRIVNELSAPWRTHLGVHKSSTHHGNPMDAVRQAQDSPAEALPTQGPSGKPTNDQRAALNRWEGEGGKTAATPSGYDAQERS
jgi:hypothetical protein